MPLSQCPKSWLLRDNRNAFVLTGDHNDHYFMDVRQSAVREAVISLAIARAKHNGLDAVCFDNCYWGLMPRVDFPVSAAEWTSAYMEFYREAGNEVHKAGLKCVVNVATYPGSIPAAFAEIAPFVDGIMTEMAFYKSVRTPEGLYKELKGYENVLKQGKMVLLIPFNKEDEQFALLAIRPLAKKYGRIYLAAAGLTHYEPLYFLADSEWDIAAD